MIFDNAWRSTRRRKGYSILLIVVFTIITAAVVVSLAIMQAANSAKTTGLANQIVTATIRMNRSQVIKDAGGAAREAMDHMQLSLSDYETYASAAGSLLKSTYYSETAGLTAVDGQAEPVSSSSSSSGSGSSGDSSSTDSVSGDSAVAGQPGRAGGMGGSFSDRIIVSMATLTSLGLDADTSSDTTISYAYVLGSGADYDAFVQACSDAGLSDSYQVQSSDVENYESSIEPLLNLSKFAKTLLVVVLALGAVILIAMTLFSIRTRTYEMGVMTAMGMHKRTVVAQMVVETVIVAVIGLAALAILVLALLSGLVGVIWVLRYEPLQILADRS